MLSRLYSARVVNIIACVIESYETVFFRLFHNNYKQFEVHVQSIHV